MTILKELKMYEEMGNADLNDKKLKLKINSKKN